MLAPRAVLAGAHAGLARVASPYPGAAVLALGAFAAFDALVSGGPRDDSFALSLAGLVLLVGAAAGLLLQGALALVARLPAQGRQAVWAFVACFGAGLLALRLNAFANLQGRYANA